MKKISSLFVALLLLIMSSLPAWAQTERVSGTWALTAPRSLDFVCEGYTFNHMLNTVTNNTPSVGLFTGTGYYIPNQNLTWDVNGTIIGDAITFHVVYTGIGAGTVYNLTGTIAPDGSISGTSDRNCQTFSMPAGTAMYHERNHGQYVRSQEDKQEAAQSREGMPEKSRGHIVDIEIEVED